VFPAFTDTAEVSRGGRSCGHISLRIGITQAACLFHPHLKSTVPYLSGILLATSVICVPLSGHSMKAYNENCSCPAAVVNGFVLTSRLPHSQQQPAQQQPKPQAPTPQPQGTLNPRQHTFFFKRAFL